MNLVKWEVSVPAVRVVIGSALSIAALTLLVEMTVLMGRLHMYFFKVSKTRQDFTFWVRVLD